MIQTLWDELGPKGKVRLNQRVVKVESTETGVRVHTADGAVHAGDLVIGADGIHSVVRREMKRIAAEAGVGTSKNWICTPESNLAWEPRKTGFAHQIRPWCGNLENQDSHTRFEPGVGTSKTKTKIRTPDSNLV